MLQVTYRMINIPIPDDPDQRRILFGEYANEIGEETTFSRTMIVYATTDMSSRNAWMCTPQEITLVIDYNTMMPPVPPTERMEQFVDGACYWYSEPRPVVRNDYREFTSVQTWSEFGRTDRADGPVNALELKTAAVGRRLPPSLLDEENNPIYSHQDDTNYHEARLQYFCEYADVQRSDRIPYHLENFHELGQPRHGENVPPFIIRRPSNESLEGLLPRELQTGGYIPPRRRRVRSPVRGQPDVAVGRVEDAEPPVEAPPANRTRRTLHHNPIPNAIEEQQLQEEYGIWMTEIEANLQLHNDLQHPRPQNPFIFHGAHARAINAHHGRNFRLARRLDRAREEAMHLLPPPGQLEDRLLLPEQMWPVVNPRPNPPPQVVVANPAAEPPEGDLEEEDEYIEEDDV